jgi:hypothetical protein
MIYRKKIISTQNSIKPIKDLLPNVINKIGSRYSKNDKNILSDWKNIIGEKLAPLTIAKSINDGKLLVIVKSSTLYSLLVQHEKFKILKILQKKYSKAVIKDIIFRIG